MTVDEVIKEYEAKFNESISIPIFNMPEGKTIDDFVKELQRCIEKNERFDEEAFGMIIEEDRIY
jgi:hypothetical protein